MTATAERASVCPMDCPDTCSLTVTVADERVVKVRGSRANPITEGVLCNKVSRYYPEFVHGKERLTVPLKRVGAKGAWGPTPRRATAWPGRVRATGVWGSCRGPHY